jgi:hypothetical protein
MNENGSVRPQAAGNDHLGCFRFPDDHRPSPARVFTTTMETFLAGYQETAYCTFAGEVLTIDRVIATLNGIVVARG